jgi:hypothetical protein
VTEDEGKCDLLHPTVGEGAAVDEGLVVVEEGMDEQGAELEEQGKGQERTEEKGENRRTYSMRNWRSGREREVSGTLRGEEKKKKQENERQSSTLRAQTRQFGSC